MAEPSTIARPYAEAVFQLADAGGQLAEWSAMLGGLAQVVDDPRVRQVIANPNVSIAKTVGLVCGVLSGRLTAEAENFVRVLADNRRLPLMNTIRDQFERLKDAREASVEVVIATAFALTDPQLADIVAQIGRNTGRNVKARVEVEKELIGGARITIGDKVFDASARAQLAALGSALKI